MSKSRLCISISQRARCAASLTMPAVNVSLIERRCKRQECLHRSVQWQFDVVRLRRAGDSPVAGVPKEQLMAQLGPFLGSAISTVTQTYEKKMQV